MATRVSPSEERLRRDLDEKLAGIEGSEDPIEAVARLGGSGLVSATRRSATSPDGATPR